MSPEYKNLHCEQSEKARGAILTTGFVMSASFAVFPSLS